MPNSIPHLLTLSLYYLAIRHTAVFAGQFDAMTVTERKVLAEAWVAAAKPHALYVIVNVGTTVQSEAIDLAAHAASIGASAVAAVCFPTCHLQPALI